MPHRINLYPNSESSVFDLMGLRSQLLDPEASEIWVDLRIIDSIQFDHEIWKYCKSIVVYDWFHAVDCVNPVLIDKIKKLQNIAPVKWVSTHQLNLTEIPHVRWDYMWNRTKLAYLDKTPTWKHGDSVNDYQQYPLNWQPRPLRYLQLFNRLDPYRSRLSKMVKSFNGYWSDVNQGVYLMPNNTTSRQNYYALPNQEIMDATYISCQVESTYLSGYGIGFTEKTYDHLIQGRIVLNFGPAGFYQALAQDGWKLYKEIDLSWDSIVNNELRFDAYLSCLEDLFNLSDSNMHDLFLLNKDVIISNYNRLKEKPYDYFD